MKGFLTPPAEIVARFPDGQPCTIKSLYAKLDTLERRADRAPSPCVEPPFMGEDPEMMRKAAKDVILIEAAERMIARRTTEMSRPPTWGPSSSAHLQPRSSATADPPPPPDKSRPAPPAGVRGLYRDAANKRHVASWREAKKGAPRRQRCFSDSSYGGSEELARAAAVRHLASVGALRPDEAAAALFPPDVN